MRVNKIFFITVFMCAFTTGIVNARTLHFGDKTIALSQTKYTTPSLAFAIGNETWYAPLTTEQLTDTIHIRFNNITYSVTQPDGYAAIIAQNCPEIFTDTENYTYDANGRLIGADENVYLQSTKTQLIDTGFYASPKTRAELVMKVAAGYTYTASLFFGAWMPDKTNGFHFCMNYNVHNMTTFQPWLCPYQSTNCQYKYVNTPTNYLLNKLTYVLDAKNRFAKMGTYSVSSLSITTNAQTTKTLFLFGYSRPSGVAATPYPNNLYVYSTKLYENDVLMRHFVPVPACMRIGNFVVPENGMWDIVEQKFYGNSGTGSFIYGKDE